VKVIGVQPQTVKVGGSSVGKCRGAERAQGTFELMKS